MQVRITQRPKEKAESNKSVTWRLNISEQLTLLLLKYAGREKEFNTKYVQHNN